MRVSGVLGGIELVLDPIHFLLVAEVFDEPLIIGIVVLLLEGGKLLKSFDEQPFAFEVGKPERTDDLLHALALCPRLDRAEEGVCDFLIVDAVKPRKADALLFPLFVALVVQNARDAPDDFFAAVCEVVDRLGIVVIVVIGAEDLHFVGIQRRNEVWISLIEFQRKFHERLALSARGNLFDFNHFFLSLQYVFIVQYSGKRENCQENETEFVG